VSRRFADSWIGCLLHCYPPAFRARFGAELRALMLAGLAQARRRGQLSAASFVCRSTLNTIAAGAAERTRRLGIDWFSATHLGTPKGAPSKKGGLSDSWDTPDPAATYRGHHMLTDTFRTDVRHAVRMGLKTPLFTASAILALALGIGASSAIFTVVNGVLLRPLPYQNPDRLVMIWSQNQREGRERNVISPANFTDYRALSHSFSGMESTLSFLVPLAIKGQESEGLLQALRVGPDLFRVLGRDAAIGRTFGVGEDRGVAVLSHGFWQRRFGSDPSVVGRSFTFSENEHLTVIGVMPPDFAFPYRTMLGPTGFSRAQTADIWIVMPFEGPRWVTSSGALVRNVHALASVARLAPGVTLDQARADLSTVATQLAQAYPDSNSGWGATAVSMHDQTVGDVRPALLLLLGGVAVVLLMASVNVANLVLARSVSRQQELSVRIALGANRGRLVQQAFTESLMLSCAGGLAALLVAHLGVQALVALAPADLPRLADIRIDARVVLFTLSVAVATGTLVGLAPALAASRPDLRGALQESTRGSTGASPGRRRLRAALVVVEIALAVVLTVGAGLLLRSFTTVLAVDPGFKPEQLLTLQMNVPDHLTTPDARRAFYEDFFARMEQLPGVTAVGGTTRLPLGSTNVSTTVMVEGRSTPTSELPEVEFRRSMHDYFKAMGIPVLHGRGFTAEDHATAPAVAVINQTMARRVFGTTDPIGVRIRTGPGSTSPWITIVGIIGDVRHSGLEADPAPEMYINYLQNPPVAPFMVFRTTGDPVVLADLVRAEARAQSASMPVFDVRTMLQIRSESVAERRFTLLLVGLFGLLALTLAASGVYGVMALIVSERTGEIGLRMALGAEPRRMVSLVVGHALTLAAIGVGAGLLVALGVAPLIANQLFGVGAWDPITLVAVPIVLVTVAALAALVPAARAMRLDPVTALRHT